MRTHTGKDCTGSHRHNGKSGAGLWDVYTINGRRYTVCAHTVGDSYCGALIDVTDSEVVICCGNERNHEMVI